jgi:hypothetical protein
MSSKIVAMLQDGLQSIDRAYQVAPPELQYLRNQSTAFLYRYCADLALTNSFDKDGLNFAREKLWVALKLYPQLLKERYAQKLIVKLLLQQLLPRKFSSFLIQALKKQALLPDPRLPS